MRSVISLSCLRMVGDSAVSLSPLSLSGLRSLRARRETSFLCRTPEPAGPGGDSTCPARRLQGPLLQEATAAVVVNRDVSSAHPTA